MGWLTFTVITVVLSTSKYQFASAKGGGNEFGLQLESYTFKLRVRLEKEINSSWNKGGLLFLVTPVESPHSEKQQDLVGGSTLRSTEVGTVFSYDTEGTETAPRCCQPPSQQVWWKQRQGTFENASHNQLLLVRLKCRPLTKNNPTIRGSANGKGAAIYLPWNKLMHLRVGGV